MTHTLAIAVEQAGKLPPEEQDVLASILIEEIASEQRVEDGPLSGSGLVLIAHMKRCSRRFGSRTGESFDVGHTV